MKPWEKYQVAQNDQSPATSEGPWSKYQAPAESPGVLGRLKKLFSPETKKEVENIEADRAAEMDKQRASGTTLGQTELEHFGNALTFGYLPQIQAGAEHALTGEDYVTARDANVKRMEAQAATHPVNAAAGDVAGTATNAYLVPLPTVGKGAGIVGGALKGAQYGALQGAIQNPGDMEGEYNPLQLDERVQNAKEGAKLGGIIGGGAGLGQRVGQGVQKLSEKLKGGAEAAAFKSSGAMLKDFRQAAGDKANKIGRFMLDEGIVKAGDTYESVAQKAAKINETAGNDLDRIYNKAVEGAGEKMAQSPGFNPTTDKAAIIEAVKKDLGDAPGAANIAQRVEAYIDGLAAKYGDTVLPPRLANDVKGFVDKEINYARNPLSKKPKTEKAYSTLRKFLEEKIFNQVEFLGKASGSEGLGKELRDVNQRYSYSKTIKNVAADRVNRISANNAFGLSDRMAGGAGAIVAGGAAAASGDTDPMSIAEKGIATGLLSAAGNHVVGRYGLPVLAQGLERSGRLLEGPAQISQGLLAQPGKLGRVGVGLSRKSKKKGLIDVRPGLVVPVTEGYEQ